MNIDQESMEMKEVRSTMKPKERPFQPSKQQRMEARFKRMMQQRRTIYWVVLSIALTLLIGAVVVMVCVLGIGRVQN
jgi:hypothetical protein